MTRARLWLLIGVTAVLTAACATAPEAPTVDITGNWAGNWAFTNPSMGGGQAELKLKQKGGDFNGDMVVSGAAVNRTGYIQGTVSGNQVRIIAPPGLSGQLTVTGDEMKGILHGVADGNATLRRQR